MKSRGADLKPRRVAVKFRGADLKPRRGRGPGVKERAASKPPPSGGPYVSLGKRLDYSGWPEADRFLALDRQLATGKDSR